MIAEVMSCGEAIAQLLMVSIGIPVVGYILIKLNDWGQL